MNQTSPQVYLKLWQTKSGSSMLVVSCNQSVIHYTSFYTDPDISVAGNDTCFWKQTLLRHTENLLIEQSIGVQLGSSVTCWCLSSQTTSCHHFPWSLIQKRLDHTCRNIHNSSSSHSLTHNLTMVNTWWPSSQFIWFSTTKCDHVMQPFILTGFL